MFVQAVQAVAVGVHDVTARLPISPPLRDRFPHGPREPAARAVRRNMVVISAGHEVCDTGHYRLGLRSSPLFIKQAPAVRPL